MHRRWHHDQLTFRSVYASSEQFVLPLSHDEVVHGKGSLLATRWRATPGSASRTSGCCSATSSLQPGKKLLFMGDEFGQEREWSARARARLAPLRATPATTGSLRCHRRSTRCTASAGRCTVTTSSTGASPGSTATTADHSVLCVERHDDQGLHLVMVVQRHPRAASRLPRRACRLPVRGRCGAASDELAYGGSGYEVPATVEAASEPLHNRTVARRLRAPTARVCDLRERASGTGPGDAHRVH